MFSSPLITLLSSVAVVIGLRWFIVSSILVMISFVRPWTMVLIPGAYYSG